jgi:hypothetical protein
LNATEKICKAFKEETLNEDSLRTLWQKAARAVEKIRLYTESIIAGSGDLDPEDNVELDYLQEFTILYINFAIFYKCAQL